MRIIQITDIHITPEGADSFGVDTKGNFQRILAEAKALAPDKVVITGDFCFRDPQPEIYEWIKAQLDEQGIEIDLISGNHDDPPTLAKVFGMEDKLHENVIYYQTEWMGRRVYFLDSTVGVVSKEQLAWLQAELAKVSGPVIVFVHHPPVNAGVPHMDHSYSLKNREALLSLLESYAHPVNVFSGHYHVEKTINRGNVTMQITPSCFVQIHQYQEQFVPDHHRIALRVITLREKEILSTVHYFDGAQKEEV